MELSGADIPSSPPSAAPPPAPPSAPAYKDRSTALVIFGIIEIAGGVLSALAVPFALIAAVLGRKASDAQPITGFALIALTYLALAALLITLGIGAIQAQRWAWALNLILSWIWLILGVLITLFLIILLPRGFLAGMRSAALQNPGARPVPPGIMAAVLTFFIVCFAVVLIVLPLVFLLFYRSKDVEQTCKACDPLERWTDRRPLPVLAFALLASVGCTYYLLTSFTTPAPFFGRYLTGLPAVSFFLILAAVDAYVAYSFFRLKVAGWWVAVISMAIRLVSAILTVRAGNLMQAYSRMGWSQRQLDMIRANPMLRSGFLMGWTIVVLLLYFGFLLWLRRYFRPRPTPSYTGTSDSLLNPIPPEN
ncbi:MAG TPA: hypothetical protein VEV41_00805 [Terriglobales bacterium]|nr:hypothetical protein [Terriglobales bacterium]